MNTTVAVDQYIAKSAEFAIPILEHFRKIVHKADDRIEEKIKWGMPFFDFKGSVCHMAAFKKHCAIGFWKASIMEDDYKIFKEKSDAMGWLGKIKSFDDLPSDDVLTAYIQLGIRLNEDGIKLPSKLKKIPSELIVPKELINELQKDPKALSIFQNFSHSNKKDYVVWIEEAKTGATKQKRLETAVEWIGEGKTRMWKYKK